MNGDPAGEGFPLDALSLVIKAVKSGDYSDPRALALAAVDVLRFAVANLFGPGAGEATGAGAPARAVKGGGRKPSKAKAIEALSTFVDSRRGTTEGAAHAPPGAADFPVPWGVVFEIAIDLLSELRKRAA